ncbi:hypothetical protein FIBSPDRAFT_939097 [Athelia psychrophila]|uniref:Uncharacterized protein n=1 Tax=Athelia psychrophila TaxID=1759441 RepID=A0A165X776_9AGAM|nr:hypothetical protein FIBSPDRAFT_939097 [Fibularhizoctonia sp. CBS 109695]
MGQPASCAPYKPLPISVEPRAILIVRGDAMTVKATPGRDLLVEGSAYSGTAGAFNNFRRDTRHTVNHGTGHATDAATQEDVNEKETSIDLGADVGVDIKDLAIDEEEFPVGTDLADFVAMYHEMIDELSGDMWIVLCCNIILYRRRLGSSLRGSRARVLSGGAKTYELETNGTTDLGPGYWGYQVQAEMTLGGFGPTSTTVLTVLAIVHHHHDQTRRPAHDVTGHSRPTRGQLAAACLVTSLEGGSPGTKIDQDLGASEVSTMIEQEVETWL